ncbi:MAG: efflux RND transporter periplasmic adaptor subunit [Snowella sp.]|nr:efflux RND transporter periplasmic adaptor subunit [Snowella sp.]
MVSKVTENTQYYKKKKNSLLNQGKWLLGIILLIGLGWGGYQIYQQTVVLPQAKVKQEKGTIAVQREDLAVTVTANGTIQPEVSINISPKNAGVLKSLYVKEGDRVKKGQLLAQMDDSNLQGQLLQMQGQLLAAQANLQKLEAGNRPQDIMQAQAELAQAQANLQRLKAGNRSQEVAQAKARYESALSNQRQAEIVYQQNQQLYQQGAISERDWANSRAQRDIAQAQVREAQQALNLQTVGTRPEEIQQAQAVVRQKQAALSLAKAGSRSEDIAQARAQVIAAQGNLKTVQTQIQDMEIRAPFAGIVTRKYADPGAFVTPTTAGSAVSSATSSSILSLASQNRVVTNIAESNIAQMRLGQKARIKADAYPDQRFTGEVTQIAPQSIVQQNVTSFEVKVSILDDQQSLLKAGMNVQVTFEVDKLNDVLVVPTVAIVRQIEGTGVYRWKDGQSQFIPIQTGVTVNDKTEIRSGLQENDKILITFPEGKRPKSQIPVPPGASRGR